MAEIGWRRAERFANSTRQYGCRLVYVHPQLNGWFTLSLTFQTKGLSVILNWPWCRRLNNVDSLQLSLGEPTLRVLSLCDPGFSQKLHQVVTDIGIEL